MRRSFLSAGIMVLMFLLAAGLLGRHQLADALVRYHALRHPLPIAQPFHRLRFSPSAGRMEPTSTAALVWSGALPASVNLAVPFLSQAPTQIWSMPYQEACEEAAVIMVQAYYQGRSKPFSPQEGDAAILSLTNFSGNMFHGRADTSAAETAAFAQAYFPGSRDLVREISSPRDIQAALAQGYPVIVPAYGKALGNPNFRQGGPLYHMLVIKGYTQDGDWIANDPGTRKGADYIYHQSVLMHAIHDWNNGDVPHGPAKMLVMLP